MLLYKVSCNLFLTCVVYFSNSADLRTDLSSLCPGWRINASATASKIHTEEELSPLERASVYFFTTNQLLMYLLQWIISTDWCQRITNYSKFQVHSEKRWSWTTIQQPPYSAYLPWKKFCSSSCPEKSLILHHLLKVDLLLNRILLTAEAEFKNKLADEGEKVFV